MNRQPKKRIGVIMPAITETLDTLYLDGICRQLHACGYDVIILTCASNAQNETLDTAYVRGEESIYQLVAGTRLDGLIFAGGKFHDPAVADRILKSLCDIKCPCVCTDYANPHFPNVYVSQSESMQRITKHLIEVHGFRRIFCLTGRKDNPDAEARLSGWQATMKNAGLSAKQFRYGDFWLEKAAALADEIASGAVPLPEAVVCANDIMAISLCKRLAAHGIRVPQDIAVTGFDGGTNALLAEPSVTTVDGKEFELGSNAALALLTEIDGQPRCRIQAQTLPLGTSCGCRANNRHDFLEKIYETYLKMSERREMRLMSDYINKMAAADTLGDLRVSADELAYILPNWNDLYVCIQPIPESDAENPPCGQQTGYPERMMLLVSKHRNRQSDDAELFDTASFLPEAVLSEEPQLLIATPLHNADRLFGYIVTSYSDPKQYAFDDLYVGWRDSVSNALSVQYIKAQNRLLNQRPEEFSGRDRMTGMPNLKGLAKQLSPQRKYVCILLKLQWIHTPANAISMMPELFLANALQMNCAESEICFRFNADVFGVFLPLPEKLDAGQCCEEWKMRFDVLMDLVRRRERNLEQPVIRFYYLTEPALPLLPEEFEQTVQKQIRDDKKPSAFNGNYAQQLEDLRCRIIRNPSEEWSLNGIAAAMQISDSYLRRIYRQHFGISLHSDLVKIRMSRAMKLLRRTNRSIKAVAAQCGYPNMYHFMTAFKKETGMTLTEFRETGQ